ncbi:MAG: hypothetical protein IH956_05275 [Chloroflexi bacterium]|nr:hypothetical protein [Chloroflexota bacterium]
MVAVRNYEVRAILADLRHEEKRLADAERAVQEAAAHYRIAESHYVAIRDFARQSFGRTPYSTHFIEQWGPDGANLLIGGDDPSFGKYRFRGMKVGDAIVEYLTVSGGDRDIDQIIAALSEGGMRNASRRPINAALMNTTGIVRTEGPDYAHYSYEEPETAEDSPW